MAWKSAAYTGTHQERKLASKAIRGNVRRDAVADAMDAEVPPRKSVHKKSFGLIIFHGSRDRKVFGEERWGFYEWVNWYATERDRDNAIKNYNRAADDQFLPVVALGKVDR